MASRTAASARDRRTLLRPGRILVLGIATVTVGLAAAPALASGTWTIHPGGNIAIGTSNVTLKDTDTGATTTCMESQVTAKLKSGSGLPGTDIGTITKAALTKCRILGTRSSFAASLPWHINVASYSHGLVQGTIGHVAFTAGNGACVFQVSGKAGGGLDGIVRFSYSDSTNRGTFTGGNLRVVNLICGAQIVHKGDHISMSASFSFDPAQVITSP